IEQTVTNWTYRDKTVRVHVPVGVAYGTDTELVSKLLIEVARAHPLALADPEPAVQLTTFGSSSLDFVLLVWIPDPAQRKDVISDMNFAIDAACREHGVEIPFPQQDIHIIASDA
ncbi:MAG: mechanosensitive ion channel protein MscS, partial [Candidatus Poribacteria bacterium]